VIANTANSFRTRQTNYVKVIEPTFTGLARQSQFLIYLALAGGVHATADL